MFLRLILFAYIIGIFFYGSNKEYYVIEHFFAGSFPAILNTENEWLIQCALFSVNTILLVLLGNWSKAKITPGNFGLQIYFKLALGVYVLAVFFLGAVMEYEILNRNYGAGNPNEFSTDNKFIATSVLFIINCFLAAALSYLRKFDFDSGINENV